MGEALPFAELAKPRAGYGSGSLTPSVNRRIKIVVRAISTTHRRVADPAVQSISVRDQPASLHCVWASSVSPRSWPWLGTKPTFSVPKRRCSIALPEHRWLDGLAEASVLDWPGSVP